jgi:hypothetical protein
VGGDGHFARVDVDEVMRISVVGRVWCWLGEITKGQARKGGGVTGSPF